MDTSSSDDSSIEGILENGFPSSKMKNDRPTVGSGDDEYSTDSSYEFSSKLDEIEENGATSTGLPDIISEKSTGYTQPSNAPAYTIRAFELPTMPYISATLNSLHSQEELQHPKVISETDKISNIFGKHTMRDHEQFISHREKLECSLTKYFSKLAIVDQICVEQFEEEQTAPFPLRALKQTCMCDFPEDSECSICKQKLSDLASLCDSALDVMDEIYDCLVESTKSKTFPLSITRFTRETLERIIKSNENFESRSVPNSSLYRMIYRDELADNNPNSTVTEYIFQRICNRHSQFQIANIAEELSIIGKTHENATEKSSRKDITENNKKKKGLVKQSNRSPAGGSVRSRITKETSKNNTLKDSPASRTRSKIDSPASRTRSKSSKIINSNEKGKDSKITVLTTAAFSIFRYWFLIMDTSSSDDSSVEYILENGFPSSKMENDRPTIGRADVEYSSDSSCDVFAELEHPVKVTTDDRVLNVQVPDVSGITELNSLFVESSVFEMIVPFPVYGHAEEDREQFLSHREKLESSLTKYFSKLATVDQICVEQFEEEQTAPFPLRALKQTCMCDFPEDSECSICKKKLSDLASLCDSALDVMDQIYDCLYNGSTSVTIPISLICLAGETLERIIKSNENFESRSVPNSSLYRMIYRDELADNNPNSTVTEYIFQRICNRHSQFQIANIAEELSIIGKTHENATEKSSRKDITENNKKKKGLVKQSNRSPAGGSVRSRITKETSKNNTLKDSPASRTRSKNAKTKI